MQVQGFYSVLCDSDSSMIIFVGDWVRQDDNWYQVVECDGGMQIKISDGRWLWADSGDVDQVLSDAEYKELADAV